MPFSIDNKLGVNLSDIYPAGSVLPMKVGTVVRGDDGRMYVLATASGSISNATAVVLTEPAMTIAAGAGAWTTRSGALTTGQSAWVQSNAI